MRATRVTRKDVLFLSISFFVIVVAWIGFNLYHTWVTSTISEDLQMQIIPIDPTFDMATINKLKTREKITPLFALGDLQASQEAQLSPTPTIRPVTPLEFVRTPTPSQAPSPTPFPTSEILEEDIIPTEEPTPIESGPTP